MSNPYSGEPPTVTDPATESGVSSEPTEAAVTAPDINPDVAAADPRPASETEAHDGSEKPAGPPSLLDRIRALEVKVFGGQHPDDPGDEPDTDD